MKISSVPAGARIEINSVDVGETPVTVEIDSTPRGTFRKDTVIRAYPSGTGYIQVKAFNGARWSINDLIPKEISFDTRIDPTMSLKAP
ncbi:MAG: PEGA domain-containing protein [Verrucomicrobia bacterium]|nr:PEGA domain-containing protein [Verrucomicrobiota bacterium]